MSIRLPLTTVGDFSDNNDTGTGSVSGGWAHAFYIPQDTDNVVVKMMASIVGAVSTTLQTTDDAGTTWYDIARTSIVSNASSANAEWISAPVIGIGVRTTVQAVASVGSHNQPVSVYSGIGKADAGGLGQKEVTGLPVLGRYMRVFGETTGDVTAAASNTWRTVIYANSQSTPS